MADFKDVGENPDYEGYAYSVPKKRGAKRVPESRKIRKLKIGLTPFLYRVIEEVSEKAGGLTLSRTVRGLIFLGYARYRELGCKLPELDR